MGNSDRATALVTPLPAQESTDNHDYEISSFGSIVISDFSEGGSCIGSAVIASGFDGRSSGIGNVLVSEYDGDSDYDTIRSDAASDLNRDILSDKTFSFFNETLNSYDWNGLLNNRSEENDEMSELGSVYDSIAPSLMLADDQVNNSHTSLHRSISNINSDREVNGRRD
eukprot:gene32588-42207_t